MNPPLGYRDIQALAAEIGRTIKDLIVLARNNDPFFIGTPAHVRDAEWFADWWRKLGYEGRRDVHVRGLHYILVSQDPPPVMPSRHTVIPMNVGSGLATRPSWLVT
jgi:hypothetical protein